MSLAFIICSKTGLLLQHQLLERHAPGLGDLFIYDLAFDDVEALAEFLVVGTCLAPAFIGKLQCVGQCSVGERKS